MRLPLRLGTRGSPLALAQAEIVRAALGAAHAELAPQAAVQLVVVKTTGDRILDRPLAEVGGKGLFTKELEEALLAGTIDLAVHSMKDMATALPDRLAVGAVLQRADPRDALIGASSIAALARGAVVGTASLRRAAQILAARADLSVIPLRGNVQTRLRKLREGEVAATLLALAGLHRLGLDASVEAVLEPSEMLPAVGQGAIAVQMRVDDERLHALLLPLDHIPSHCCVRAERAMLAALDGSCRTPIAGHAVFHGPTVELEGLLCEPDGSNLRRASLSASPTEPEALGREVAARLRH